MNDRLDQLLTRVSGSRRKWLVTGAAGFIGSHLVEALLRAGQDVIGMDNLSTGGLENIAAARLHASPFDPGKFSFHEADIVDQQACSELCRGVDIVLHQAALGSVPRSLDDPIATHQSNSTGFLNMMVAAGEASVDSFIYAASSSTYGDHQALPKREDVIGAPLSPYAVTKLSNEQYASVLAPQYSMTVRGLRYFNVFGPRQDPDGAYAAVIPKWIHALANGKPVFINGDGLTSRDFCYVANVVQANLLAALAHEGARPVQPGGAGYHRVYNVAAAQQTTLLDLHGLICKELRAAVPGAAPDQPRFRDFRPGDVRHSLADISRARTELGYEPTHDVKAGLRETIMHFLETKGSHD